MIKTYKSRNPKKKKKQQKESKREREGEGKANQRNIANVGSSQSGATQI